MGLLRHKKFASSLPATVRQERGVWRSPGRTAAILICVSMPSLMTSCGGGGAATSPNPPSTQAIQVSVTPASTSVLLGNTVAFNATVTGTSDSGVTWSVNGIAGGSAATGRISEDGVYTAPADLPSPATVNVAATSRADASKSGSASVTVTSDIVLSVAPNPPSIELGATLSFHATVSSSGHPDAAVRWSVTGAACPNACGAVDANGNYTAPQILPSAPSVVLTAQSVADPSKQASVA